MVSSADTPAATTRHSGWDIVTAGLWTLLCVILAVGLAVWLSSAFDVESVAPIFIFAVVFAATAFGPSYGLLAAASSVLALDYFLPPEPVAPSLDSAGALVHLVLFVGAALVAGAYAPAARRRTAGVRKLASKAPDASALAHALELAAAEDPPLQTISVKAVRLLNALAIVFGAAVTVYFLRSFLDTHLSYIVMLSAAVAAATLYGAAIGMGAAALAALTSVALTAATLTITQVSGQQAFLTLGAFVGLAWLVGRLSDKMRTEREALVTMLRNGRDLSATASETAVRETLVKALSEAVGGLVRVVDEGGGLKHDNFQDGAQAPPLAQLLDMREAFAVEGWRSRKLTGDGRDLGAVIWKVKRGSGADPLVRDALVDALIDLGASAIARARLSAEKDEMEFVARTEQLRTILLDAVSHHFRTPLAGIMGSATSLLAFPTDKDPARRELLLIIKEQANRLNRYVDNFLSVARLESGAVDIQRAEVQIEPLLYDVWETFGEAGGARRFLDVEIDPTPVWTDPALLKQILGNVLENAIKYSNEESVVSVRTLATSDSVVIEVADQGPGVAPENRDRIFQRFFRAGGTRAPGLGLGLYITRSLSELLGGGVTAGDRRDGEPGLLIAITLPSARPPG